MFDVLLQLKYKTKDFAASAYKMLYSNCLHQLSIIENNIDDHGIIRLTKIIIDLTKEVYNKPVFKIIMNDVISLYINVKSPPQVTEDLVRESFYNLMVVEALNAIESGLLHKTKLEEMNPSVFLDLSAYTLIAVCVGSKDMKGIRLLKDVTMTIDNAPGCHKALVKIIINCKSEFVILPNEKIEILKKICCSDPDIVVEEQYKTPELIRLATYINQVSSQISRLHTFKYIITKVIDFCL